MTMPLSEVVITYRPLHNIHLGVFTLEILLLNIFIQQTQPIEDSAQVIL
jgi:hypothetical protein